MMFEEVSTINSKVDTGRTPTVYFALVIGETFSDYQLQVRKIEKRNFLAADREQEASN